MNSISAYHITNKSNIYSILKEGLVPNIGKNSRSIHEHHFLLYFTTIDNIDTWIQRFKLDIDSIVILKFPCANYIKRLDAAGDYFTSDYVLPKDITVITDKETSLIEYYQTNKKEISIEMIKMIKNKITLVMDRLKKIENVSLEPEDGWDYHETEPNLIEIIDLLKSFKYLEDKRQFVDIILFIKEKVLEKLVSNDLGVTPSSDIYKVLDILFCESLLSKSTIDFKSINYVIPIISINLFYRQLDRYNRTQKKYGDDNRIWDYNSLDIEDIRRHIEENYYFRSLLEETNELYKISQIKNKSRV